MNICVSELCSGCSLCADVCPRNAVIMKRDEEGFFRPYIDGSLCVDCGLCQKKCPVNTKNPSIAGEVYAAYSKRSEIREKSSSGGILYHIADSILRSGGVVFGAGYGEDMKIVHKCVDSHEGLKELMGSKYVQSNTQGVYKTIKEYVAEGKKVLFSGTPCQCAAVRSYIGENENLYLVDFICHGVPTPSLWEKYIKEEFPKAKAASFRSKDIGWEEFSMRIETGEKTYSCSQYKDPYLRMFLRNTPLRPSCYNCTWKGNDGYSSNITLADFWGISKVYPWMNDDKGTSVVIVRDEKGKEIFDLISKDLILKQTDIKDVAKINVAYGESASKPESREAFFEDMKKGLSFKELSAAYAKPLSQKEIIKIRAKRQIKKLLSKIYGFRNRK